MLVIDGLSFHVPPSSKYSTISYQRFIHEGDNFMQITLKKEVYQPNPDNRSKANHNIEKEQ